MKIAFFSNNYSAFGNALDPFRVELVREFARRSTAMLYFQANDFIDQFGDFTGLSVRSHFRKLLNRFQPDVVISLNRAGLINELVSEIRCPIYSWYIDNPNRFCPELRVFAPHEKIFCATKFQQEWLETNRQGATFESVYLPFCANEKVFYPAEPSDDPSKCDVSFVGTLWDPNGFIKLVNATLETESDKNELRRDFEAYLADYNFDLTKSIFARKEIAFSDTDLKNRIDDFISSKKRLDVLNALSDLKLEIYGSRAWPGFSLLLSQKLYNAFQMTSIDTPQALSALYRRSRVGLSIAHQQAQSGFPIRIFDILASGLPLVTDRHSELTELFEEGKMFLGYDSPTEARECVDRLLGDPQFYENIRRSALEEVKSKHTFQQRVDTVLGVKAINQLQTFTVISRKFDPATLCDHPSIGLDKVDTRAALGSSNFFMGYQISRKVIGPIRAARHFFVLCKRILVFFGLMAELALIKWGLMSKRPQRKQVADHLFHHFKYAATDVSELFQRHINHIRRLFRLAEREKV